MLLIIDVLDDRQRLQCRKVHLHCEVGIAAAAFEVEHVDLVAVSVRGFIPVINVIGDLRHDPFGTGTGTGTCSVDADRLRQLFPVGIVFHDLPILKLRFDLIKCITVVAVVLCPDKTV